ncbi:MAG: hypothetical protein ACREHG_03730 [Candidatus Saccharimonadales bacterium]
MNLSYPNPTNSQQWGIDLLQTTGLPTTPSNVTAMTAWGNAEGGWFHNIDQYNVLGSTQPESGSHATNSAGVQSYPSLLAGLAGNASVLLQHNMHDIYNAFAGGNASNTLPTALNTDPWGTSGSTVGRLIAQGGLPSSSNAQGTPISTSTTKPLQGPLLFSTPVGQVRLPYGLTTRVALGLVGIIVLIVGLNKLLDSKASASTVVVSGLKQVPIAGHTIQRKASSGRGANVGAPMGHSSTHRERAKPANTHNFGRNVGKVGEAAT